MKITKINNLAKTPDVTNGIISFEAVDVSVEAGADNKVVLGYKTGLTIEMNEDEIGILLAPERAVGNSLYQAGGPQIVVGSSTEELVVRYKVNTDAIPSLFKQEDIIGRMIIIKKPTIEFEFEDKSEAPKKDVPAANPE
jgi:hypothetical protein